MTVQSGLGGTDRLTLAAFLGVVLFGGLNAIAVKATVGELDPLWGAGIRFVVAALVMGLIALASGRAFPRGRSLGGGMLYGLFGFAASYGLLYTAVRDVPAGTLMVVVALTPLFTFFLAIAQRLERFRLQGLAGAVVAAIGIGIVFADQVSANVPLGALALVVLGTVAIAESGVIVKWTPRSDPFATNAVAMATGAVLLLAASLVAGETWRLPAEAATWAAVAYLVLLGSVAMFALYLFALQRWTASAVSYVTLLMPIVAVIAAAILTGDRISLTFVVGGAVVLAGVYLGAFLRLPNRTSASSAPECLPIDACPEVTPVPMPRPAERTA